MKHLTVIIILLNILTAIGQTPNNDSHWSLLWEDNFDNINTNIWEVKNNYDHFAAPAEQQVYTNRSNNVFINNGNLVLRALEENYSCPSANLNDWDCKRQYLTGLTYNYTSGSIETRSAYSPQYGYIEARIKLPYGFLNSTGLFPAFWCFSGSAGYQEIDIFEMTPGAKNTCNPPSSQFFHDRNIMTSNIHLIGPTGDCPGVSNSTLTIQDYTQWHIYAIDWSPSRIIWYVDNIPVKIYENSQINNPTTIILNLAIKPNVYGGVFPADMYIDYVKVYELRKDCINSINAGNYNFSTYDNKEKNFIQIGGAGYNNALSTTDNITMRASQYIEINGEFEVPLGASFYVETDANCSINGGLGCNQIFNPCTYDFNNYYNSIKKIIDLGNNSCSIFIDPQNPILFKATDQIILNSGVTISPSTGKVELQIVTCQ